MTSSIGTDIPLAQLEAAEADAWEAIQRGISPEFRERFGITVQRVAGAVMVLATRTEMLALNRVWIPGSSATLTSDALDEMIARARAAGASRLLAHCPAWAGSAELLVARGFVVGNPMSKLCRRAGRDLDAPSPFRIERIDARDRIMFGEIAAAGNDAPPFMADGFSSTVGDAGWHHYLAFDGEAPIAAAAMRTEGDVAWCGFAGTLPSHRGRGAQSALLARRVRDAMDAGCTWVTCETSSPSPEAPSQSLKNMRRLGFEVVYDRPNFLIELRPSSS